MAAPSERPSMIADNRGHTRRAGSPWGWAVALLAALLSVQVPAQEAGEVPLGFDRIALPDLLPLGYTFPTILSVSPGGEVFMEGFTSAGGGLTAYLRVSEGNVRELFRRGEQLFDPLGASLGFVDRAKGQFLADGTLVANVELRAEPGAGQVTRRLMVAEGTGWRVLPISAGGEPFDLIEDPGSGRRAVQASGSQRFVVRTALTPHRVFITDGAALLQEVEVFGDTVNSPFLLQPFRVLRHAHSDHVLLEFSQRTVVAQEPDGFVTHERIDWRYELDGADPRVVASGQYEREFIRGGFLGLGIITETRGTAPATTLVGGSNAGGGAYVNGSGQVLVGVRPSRNRGELFYPGFAAPTWQRIDPDGRVSVLASSEAFTNFTAYGLLDSGGLVAESFDAAGTRQVRALFPGSSFVVLRDGDVFDGTTCEFADQPAAAGQNILLGCFNTAPTSHVRFSLAVPGAPTVFRWIGEFGGEWGDAARWNPAAVPGLGDETLFDINGGYEVVVGKRQSGRSRVEAGVVTFRDADLELLGQLSVGGDADLILRGGALKTPDLVVGHLPPSELELDELAFVSVEAGATLEANTLVLGDANDGVISIFGGSTLGGSQLLVGGRAPGRVTIEDATAAFFATGIGRQAAGVVEVLGDSTFVSVETVVGGDGELRNDLTSTLTIDRRGVAFETDTEVSWRAFGLVTVGAGQRARLEILNGARMQVGGFLDLGTRGLSRDADFEDTQVIVRGVGASGPSRLEVLGDLGIGEAEDAYAELLVSTGGLVRVGANERPRQLRVGSVPDSTGLVRLNGVSPDGSRATLVVEPETTDTPPEVRLTDFQCVLGANGKGDMLVFNGALFRCDTIAIGTIPGSEGSIVVGNFAPDIPLFAEVEANAICVGGDELCADIDIDPAMQAPGLLQITETGFVSASAFLVVGPNGEVRGAGTIEAETKVVRGTVQPGINFEVRLPELEPLEGAGGSDKPGRVAALGKSRLLAALESGEPVSRVLPGVLTFDSDVTFAAGSTLLLDIEGPAPEEQDRLVVTGQLTIEEGARLVVNFGNGYAPRQGDVYSFVGQSDQISGVFTEVEVTGLQPGFLYDVDTTGGGLRLVALNDGVSLSGDGGGGGGGGGGGEPEPPGDQTFVSDVGQKVTCEALPCEARRRGESPVDPGADLVVESLGLAVPESVAASTADVSVLLHAGAGDAPPAAQHFLVARDADGRELHETTALVELAGTETVIRRDDAGRPLVVTEGVSATGLRYRLEARADGRAIHEITDPDAQRVAAVRSEIPGAAATVAEDGTLDVVVPVTATTRAVVEVSATGRLRSRYERLQDGEWRLASRTLDPINDFAPGSTVVIEAAADAVRLVIEARVADALVF
jgi:hypothetical protein